MAATSDALFNEQQIIGLMNYYRNRDLLVAALTATRLPAAAPVEMVNAWISRAKGTLPRK